MHGIIILTGELFFQSNEVDISRGEIRSPLSELKQADEGDSEPRVRIPLTFSLRKPQ